MTINRQNALAEAFASLPLSKRVERRLAFWEKVAVGDECWEWLSATKPGGYGAYKINGTNFTASRVAFELWHGRAPGGLVLHRCDNPRCVRPGHLFEGTPQSNMDDKVQKGRHRNQWTR